MNPKLYERIVVVGSTEQVGAQLAEHVRCRTDLPVHLFHRRTDFAKLHGSKRRSINTLVIMDEELSSHPTGRNIRGLPRNGARLDKATLAISKDDSLRVVLTHGDRSVLHQELQALFAREPRYYRVIRGNAW